MTKSKRIYTMKQKTLNTKYPNGCYCSVCNRQLDVGDRVVSNYQSNNRTKVYCIECAKRLNVVV